MAGFLADALQTADLPTSMRTNAVGWGDYVRARRDDPGFEVACQEIDLIVRHALLIQLESRAAAGDYKAAKLLGGGLAEIREELRGQGVITGSGSLDAGQLIELELARARCESLESLARWFDTCPACEAVILHDCRRCGRSHYQQRQIADGVDDGMYPAGRPDPDDAGGGD